MSLFKVRQFWSFDLHQLAQQCCPPPHGAGDESAEGSFIGAVGSFHSIGSHEVFVVAKLNGFICIVQVPDEQQSKLSANNSSPHAAPDPSQPVHLNRPKAAPGAPDFSDRQLLLATQLPFAVVDLKCGFFTSALKQSLAVLSFDKLLVYQVKRHQLDLISSDQSSLAQHQQTLSGINADLFSHELEELYRLDLLRQELGARIVVLDKHADRSLSQRPEAARLQPPIDQSAANGNSQSHKHSHRHQSVRLHLPQQDTIALQYTNQLVFSLVEHKKLRGHFSLNHPSFNDAANSSEVPISSSHRGANLESRLSNESHESQNRSQPLARCMGPMPMALLRDSKAARLAVSLSDNKIYCLALSKLMSQAKQSVVKRVAENLLSNLGREIALTSKPLPPNKALPLIELDLCSLSDWTVELTSAPLQFQPVHRSTSEASPESCQLLVLSRYSLNLFACSGELLWSQRFETPLICMFAYNLPPTYDKHSQDVTPTTASRRQDRMLSLVCIDCLSSERSNLVVLDEGHVVWSALIDTKPLQLWRARLSNLSGALVALDAKRGFLSVNYLGTNQDSVDQDLSDDESNDGQPLALLDNLEDPLLEDRLSSSTDGDHNERRKLLVEVNLEAINQWPNVIVHCSIILSPNSTASGVLQNIIATLEHDDQIRFENRSGFKTSSCSDGAAQVHVGSCWADRKEPIAIECDFSLRSTNFGGLETLDQIDRDSQQVFSATPLMPKSLKVNLLIRFNESHSCTSLQEESFWLPINLVAKLEHIDYSTGQEQSLDDIQTNLHQYKRLPSTYTVDGDASRPSGAPYYLCDLFIRTQSDLISLIDHVIESDLVCRGLNPESMNPAPDNPERNKLSTIENMNLLAQSLDCRLRYRSHSRASQVIRRSNSEDTQLPAIVSIALKAFSGHHLIDGIENAEAGEEDSPYTTVWIHLWDTAAVDGSLLKELMQQHAKEWKVYEGRADPSASAGINNKTSHSIMITLESDHPVPLLFILEHLTNRLARHLTGSSILRPSFEQLTADRLDSIEINHLELLRINSFVAVSANLHDRLSLYKRHHKTEIVDRYERLKGELVKEFNKFRVTTKCVLSLSKTLGNFEKQKQEELNQLSALNKRYQNNVMRVLSDLEELRQLDEHHSKISELDFIVVGDCLSSG